MFLYSVENLLNFWTLWIRFGIEVEIGIEMQLVAIGQILYWYWIGIRIGIEIPPTVGFI